MKTIRKIWFKAKRIDNKEWVKGFYIYNFDMDQHYISIGNCYLDDPERTKQYEVIPETLCQCTGIYDKNGEWVWENDIVKTKYGRKCIVKYKCFPSFCGWDLEPLDGENKASDNYDLWSKLEVLKNNF